MKQWLLKNEYRLLVIAGMLAVSALAFEAGYLKGTSQKTNPLIVEKAVGDFQLACGKNESSPPPTQPTQQAVAGAQTQECAFVASKNSTLYHISTCSTANRIKPENKVCFSSEEEAQQKGFKRAKDCFK